MSADPNESPTPTPETTPAAAASGPSEANAGKLVMPIGRTSGKVAPQQRPAAPPPPPKRDAAKYAGATSDAPESEDDGDKPLPKVGRQSEGSKGPPPKVAVPSKRGALSADLEAELAAALSELSFEDVLKQETVAKTGTQLEVETHYQAYVVRVHHDNVFFSLDGRNEGVASLRTFKEPPEIGAQLEVIIRGYNAEEGLYEVSVPGAAVAVSDWGDIQEGSIVDAKVTAANTGGLECMVNNIRAFIPASQVSMYRVENLGQFVNEKFLCVVTEANPQRKNLVLSRRAVLEREKEEAKEATLKGLEVGQTREGVIRSVRDFGAFVDIGGVDGLIHISRMSWDRIKHPSEVVKEGEKVSVRVESIDPETGKIGLSLRNEAEHPWNDIDAKFPVGTTVKGIVSRIANFGAFVKIAPGIEGLLHISELAHHRVVRVQNHVNEGQEVEVKIVEVNKEAQRIGLSLKATLTPPEPKDKDKKPAVEEVEEAPRAPAIPRRKGDLRGGTDRPSGGEGIGLKW
ncbi:MAG TPA: S1 RNA-binding domain-containing protein [Pirellulaceae bacterium]|nr:S1 RNA-binding domain-containing protein [Pirellulaceae bacterium]